MLPSLPRSAQRTAANAALLRRRFWVVPAAAAGGFVLCLVAMWAAGAFTRIPADISTASENTPERELKAPIRNNPELERQPEPIPIVRDKAEDLRVRAPAPVSRDDGFRPLFDKAGLDGWSGLDGIWTVSDGTLTGNSFPAGLSFNTCLCSDREYADFELSFEAVTGEWLADSGVQIRSRLVDPEKFTVAGPQCDLGAQSNIIYWGNLWGEKFGGETRPEFRAGSGLLIQSSRDVQSRVVKRDYFNDVFVRCVGKRVTIKINGETTVDEEVPDLPARGIIGWQVHQGKPMTVQFRHVKIRAL